MLGTDLDVSARAPDPECVGMCSSLESVPKGTCAVGPAQSQEENPGRLSPAGPLGSGVESLKEPSQVCVLKEDAGMIRGDWPWFLRTHRGSGLG